MILLFYRLTVFPLVIILVPILSIVYSPSNVGGEQVLSAILLTFVVLMIFGLGDAILCEKDKDMEPKS